MVWFYAASGGEDGGRWVTKELKTSEISAVAEKTQCLLHFSVSDCLVQKVVAALRSNLAPECFLFVFSTNRGGELGGREKEKVK